MRVGGPPPPSGFVGRLKARIARFFDQVFKVFELFFRTIVDPQDPAAVQAGASGSQDGKPNVRRVNPGKSSNTQFGPDDGSNDFMRRGRIN
mmetsp:Transcript_120025/g.340264  ORF Transcript_120025/g.340264 Transcript_120025/m.340264 type:complete len:91 (-) Transcript_120025:92-364(-)